MNNETVALLRSVLRTLNENEGYVNAQSPNYAVEIDTTSDPIIYVGKASTGAATSAAVWQIAKLDVTSGLAKTWAEGDASFNQVWDDRASITYS